MPGFGSNNVQSPQRQMSMLALKKTGLGTPALSGLCANFCTIVDIGVGQYQININVQRPFAQEVIVTATPHTSGIINIDRAGGDASTNLQIKINTFAVDGTTPAELDFDLVIIGSFASDLIGA